MSGPMLRTADVAARWSCSRNHVRRLCRTLALRAMRLGSDWRIALSEVEAYEARQMTTEGTGGRGQRTAVPAAPVALTVDGFLLPDDYEPVYPALWGLENTATASAARSAAGPGRSRGNKERRSASTKRR